tara:strand:- start:625 stop:960 length:336 start_codon:yes stop_codon:yes gene_type:complete
MYNQPTYVRISDQAESIARLISACKFTDKARALKLFKRVREFEEELGRMLLRVKKYAFNPYTGKTENFKWEQNCIEKNLEKVWDAEQAFRHFAKMRVQDQPIADLLAEEVA